MKQAAPSFTRASYAWLGQAFRALLVCSFTVLSSSCHLTDSTAADIERIELRPQLGLSLQIGQSIHLKVLAIAANRLVPVLSAHWLSDAKIAKVDSTGVVTAVSEGSTEVTVTIQGSTAKTLVTVTSNAPTLRISP